MGFQFEKLSENISFYEVLYLTVMDYYEKILVKIASKFLQKQL